MKHFRAAAAAVLAATTAASAATFEGVAEYQGKVQTGKGETIASHGTVYVSRTACRVEWETDLGQVKRERTDGKKSPAPEHYRFVMLQKLSEPDRTYILNDDRKTYSVNKTADAATKSDGTWKVKRIGRDTVAGLACEKALVTSGSDEMEICVSTDLMPSAAWIAAMNRRAEHSNPLNALKREGLNGFPIRWIFRSKAGDSDVSSTIELVRFEKKGLSPALFEIPRDYKQASPSSVAMSAEQQRGLDEARRKAYAGMTPEQRKQAADSLRKAMEKMSPDQRKEMEEQLKELENPQ